MKKFVMAFHSKADPNMSPEDHQAVVARWMTWYQEMAKNNQIIDGGTPVGKSWSVSKQGISQNGGEHPISGYSVIQAESYEAAAAIAQGCPDVVQDLGWVEIAEAVDL